MHYLVSVIDHTAGLATPGDMAAINAFNDRLNAKGHWIFTGGLAAPRSATAIDNRGEEALFTDEPFLESQEYLAGFWIIEAADLDVALKARRGGVEALQPEGRGAAAPVNVVDVRRRRLDRPRAALHRGARRVVERSPGGGVGSGRRRS